MGSVAERLAAALTSIEVALPDSGDLVAYSPIDGRETARFAATRAAEREAMVAAAHAAFLKWRTVPAPKRGELVRRFGLLLRDHKAALGTIVSIESGKILSEGLGEVQEMIDMADFAVGLSRQLHGLTISSERPGHAMRETWHPLGPVLVISAFNFPVAVWAWNACLALVCGNPVVWKPSEKGLVSAWATHAMMLRALDEFGEAPDGLVQLALGDAKLGAELVDDPRIALVSATGSTAMGRKVGEAGARRFARTLLELGGNNAAIVAPSADLELATRACLFAAVGTAGQRCTTLRRAFVHEEVYDAWRDRMVELYGRLAIGDPLEPGTLVGPLIDRAALDAMDAALTEARKTGATVHGGGHAPGAEGGCYVRPALVEMRTQAGPMLRETFAPILYAMRYSDLESAIALQNASEHGLSSAIFTSDIREAERFLAASGSDCGIANVNIGTSGAEIGGAFGGEKATGGGRESGSDAWKAYMRRQTATVNYSNALPLAQGVRFDV